MGYPAFWLKFWKIVRCFWSIEKMERFKKSMAAKAVSSGDLLLCALAKKTNSRSAGAALGEAPAA